MVGDVTGALNNPTLLLKFACYKGFQSPCSLACLLPSIRHLYLSFPAAATELAANREYTRLNAGLTALHVTGFW